MTSLIPNLRDRCWTSSREASAPSREPKTPMYFISSRRNALAAVKSSRLMASRRLVTIVLAASEWEERLCIVFHLLLKTGSLVNLCVATGIHVDESGEGALLYSIDGKNVFFIFPLLFSNTCLIAEKPLDWSMSICSPTVAS